MWSFDDPANPGRDASPGGHHGRLIGNAGLVTAVLPSANSVLELDGTNSYVELPRDAFTNLTAATVEGWIRWEEFRNMSRFFDFGETNHSINVQNRERRPDLWFEIAHGLGESNVTSIVATNVLAMKSWNHVAAVSGPAGMRLYLNGELVASNAFTGSFAAAGSGRLGFLGRSAWKERYADEDFKGQMDEVRVWEVERTREQIQENLKRTLIGNEPGLVALWNFDDPANPGRDASPAGHHGKLMGNARAVPSTISTPGAQTPTEYVLALAGDGGHVELPEGIFAGLTEATVEGWIKWSSFGYYSRFFDFGKRGGSMTVHNPQTNPSLAFEISIGDYAQLQLAVATNILRPDEWVHVAAVSGPSGMKLYANGTLVATNPETNSFAAIGNGRNYLGLANTHDYVGPDGFKHGDAPFHGQMDEVRVWNVQRTEEQIRVGMSRKLTGMEPGLVGLWNFDDPANPGRDASPGGHHGKLVGSARVSPSDRPQAPSPASFVLALDGESHVETDAVVIPTSGDYTVECWAFASASDRGGFRHLVAQDHQFYFGTNPEGKIRLGDSWINSGVSYPYDGWHHFAVVKHSTGAELYIDGAVVARRDGLLPTPSEVATFRIGRQRRRGSEDFTERWIGFIDEVRVWNAARTAEQIRENYLQNLNGTEPGLVGLWNFDDPAAGHHGQFVGGAKVAQRDRPGVSTPEIPVVDEPLTTLVPVEQRMTNMLRLDGDNGAMIVEVLQGFGVGGNQAHTLEAWIRPHVAPPVRSWPLLLGTPGPGTHHWSLAADGRTQLGAYAQATQRSVPLPTGLWTHLATVWDPTNGIYTVYVNGQTVARTPQNAAGFRLNDVPLPLWVGRRQLGFPEDSNFQGDLAELRVWNRARSREEIRENLSSAAAPEAAGLAGFWTFADATQPGKDSSTNHNDGVLTRGARRRPRART